MLRGDHILLNRVQFFIDYNYYLLWFVNKVSFLDYMFNLICSMHNQLIVMQNDWNSKSYELLIEIMKCPQVEFKLLDLD
jgi:hypothetical protein